MDSIKYEITVSQDSWGIDLGHITATYAGSEKLTADITRCCDINKMGEEGSVLLYRALVERDGSLHNVSLVFGESSFSGHIKNCIEKTSTFWRPEVQGGRPVKSYVYIFVKIDNNQDMTISYSGLSRGWESMIQEGLID